jgi:CRP/FNR family cyclic AMP-dependent transcriptional regulator
LAEQVLSRRGWLAGQPKDFRRLVFADCLLQQFERGAPVYHLGDPPGGIYGIASGNLTVSIAPDETGPFLAHLATPGDWFGEGAFLTKQPRRVGLMAATECVLLNLPLYVMELMAEEDPMAVRRFAQIAVANLDLALRAISDLMISQPERRIAAVLARAAGTHSQPVFRVSQTELGRLANASRKLVNKALHKFAASGWVEPGYNAIKIRDVQALKRFTTIRRSLSATHCNVRFGSFGDMGF